MGADAATDTGLNVVTIGPYVAAAAALLGPAPAGGDAEARLHEVVALARQLALTAAQSIPTRIATVRGVLSVADKQNNKNRTKFAVDTGQSKFGVDAMWTDYEPAAAARRTRAALINHAGRRVQATKVTVLEFYADLRPVPGETAGEQQTRTRLEPGSLFLIDDQDEIVAAIDLTAAVEQAGAQRASAQRPAAPAAAPRAAGPAATGAGKPAMVDAAQSFDRLVDRLGRDAAEAAWGDLPRTGSIPRPRLTQLAEEHGLTDGAPARAAA
jgi:hypothetical protein